MFGKMKVVFAALLLATLVLTSSFINPAHADSGNQSP